MAQDLMAPTFSKIHVAPLPGIPVISGLVCNHADCFALFSNLDDSEVVIGKGFRTRAGNG